jgi:glucokinase
LELGKPVSGTRFEGDVDNQADADTILKSWADVLNKAIESVGDGELVGIGFGMPGPFDYPNGIAQFENVAKYDKLKGVDVGAGLKKFLNVKEETPLRFMNDASALAVGEAWVGSANAVSRSMSITLGTGFGSAFIKDGIPVVEGDEVPGMGCLYHLIFNGAIADDSFSTRWFISRYKERTGIDVKGVKDIAVASETNNVAMDIFKEYGNNMGVFMGPWLKKFGAEVLVIGGNVARAYHIFGPAFESALQKQEVKTKIKLSKLQEDAAIIGSARMLDESYWVKIAPILSLM